jgi:adenylyltransferase/sulfurtransferase
MDSLDADELLRYGRHLSLPQVGLDGQRRLKAARVLLVGAGGLGSPAALYLAAAGVGRITIVDDDVVDASNLQRQVLHDTTTLGRPKVASARARLAALNPRVDVDALCTRFTVTNARELVAAHDLVLDGSDNFATRYLVNDACVLERKPDVYASVVRFDGQASIFAAPDGPCYRCLFPAPPPPELVPSCAEAGVFGVLPGLLGVVQATEAIKLLLGIGEPLVGRLMLVDALAMSMRVIPIRRHPDCPACGIGTTGQLVATDSVCTVDPAASAGEITPRELAARIDRGDDIVLIDVREPHEWAVARVEGARLIPLGTLATAMSSLDVRREIFVICQSGVRSANAVHRLRDAGFIHATNVAGGVARWRADVDPTLSKY